ncbi:hypothetical protein [Chishuiella sp.]|uniref:hypothetical protein n=1 Tax=Chishuiella sp. TaxID=1969467 RepID=UPI0028B25838|nr:hypothetical protein [Chishuiella sp.]
MKNILILIIVFLSLSCKEKKEKNQPKEADKVLKEESNKNLSTSLNFDTIKMAALPFGNKMLIDNFKKIGIDFQLSGYELNQLLYSEFEFRKFYEEKIMMNKKPFLQFYKFPQKNTIDFGLDYISPVDSISTYQGYYALTRRLPNIGENKILIFNSIDEGGILINNIDLVIVNKENKILDNLNLSRRVTSNEYGYDDYVERFFKYFYIDKDYMIHIKYFGDLGDGGIRVFTYIKYKIQEDGTIVRYFDQANGFYKTEAEEGNIKNHLKEGTWKEMATYPEKKYYIKDYKAGKIEGNIRLYIQEDIESIHTIDPKTYKIIDYDFKIR